MSIVREVAAAHDFDDFDDDFAPVDLSATIASMLVAGESRDECARVLGIDRVDVDARVAEMMRLAAAESLDEREWIVAERIRHAVRQAAKVDLSHTEASRLPVLVDLARLEQEAIASRRRMTRREAHAEMGRQIEALAAVVRDLDAQLAVLVDRVT